MEIGLAKLPANQKEPFVLVMTTVALQHPGVPREFVVTDIVLAVVSFVIYLEA